MRYEKTPLALAEQWGYHSAIKPQVAQSPLPLSEGEIGLYFTETQIQSLAPEAQLMYWKLLDSPLGLRIVQNALKERPTLPGLPTEISQWEARIKGVLFEALAQQERAYKEGEGQIILMGDELNSLITRLFRGNGVVVRNFQGMQVGVMGYSIPDGISLRDECVNGKPIWLLDQVYEFKSGTKISHGQMQQFVDPTYLAEKLLLDTRSGAGKFGWMVGKMKDRPPRDVVIDPSYRVEYVVAENDPNFRPTQEILCHPRVKYEKVPTTISEIKIITRALMSDLREVA